MRIISRRALRSFWERHPDTEIAIKLWETKVKKADWSKSNEVKLDFGSADPVGDCRIVFNIKGNQYRLLVRINYEYKIVFIYWIGSHSEYNKIDVLKVEPSIG